MSENLKTIRELADELGVSKQAIWQKIKRDTSIDLRQFTSTKGKTVYVDVDGQKAIKSMFSTDSPTRDRQRKDDVDEQDEVKFLRNLVSEIQSETRELHKLLDQQQRLALQDKKLLAEYQAEIKDLKALAMPSREDEKDVSPQSETEPVEAQTKPKKWWQFKKRGEK